VGSRLDGYEIRTAAVTHGVPCITTVQGLAATVQGIEALISGEIGVRSLQEWAADLTSLRAAQDAARSTGVDTTTTTQDGDR
jgi:carbamoyl-phosphate synthase large subunit